MPMQFARNWQWQRVLCIATCVCSSCYRWASDSKYRLEGPYRTNRCHMYNHRRAAAASVAELVLYPRTSPSNSFSIR